MPQLAVTAVVAIGGYVLAKSQTDKARADANKKADAAAAAAAAADVANAQHYAELTQNQMKLSLITGQTQDIVDVINATSQPRPVYTLPSAATPTDPVTRINQAIGDLLKGNCYG